LPNRKALPILYLKKLTALAKLLVLPAVHKNNFSSVGRKEGQPYYHSKRPTTAAFSAPQPRAQPDIAD
jgi:hypothetical protein